MTNIESTSRSSQAFRTPKASTALALAGLVALLLQCPAASANPRVFPTGTTIYDPQKAYNSFVLFGSPLRELPSG